MAQTIYPETGDAVDASVHHEYMHAATCGASFVLFGYEVVVDSGLNVTIGNGCALVGGRLINDTATTALALTDDDTRYIYLDNDGTFSELAAPDQDKDERLLIAVAVTSGGSISSISHELFDEDYFNDTYSPSTFTLSWGNVGRDVMIVKQADETINSDTTLSADADLKFAGAEGQKWDIEAVLVINSPVNVDFDVTFNSLAGGGSSDDGAFWVQNADGSHGALTDIGTAYTVDTDASDQLVVLKGYVSTGAGGAFMRIEWAQNVSDAGNTTLKAGSYLRARRILM